jgi:putative ABC transport system permease protein
MIEGQPAPRPEDAPIFWRRVIDPDYFRVMKIPDMILTIRTVTDPLRLAPTLRQAVLETDPTQPISRITPMSQYVSDAVGTPRLSALLLAAFGTTALLLAAVGIYGVISFLRDAPHP